jgi:SsrA-binding protein
MGKTYIENRKVRFEYHILDTYIAGVVLQGTEIKSIRNGKISMNDSFCYFNNGELFIKNILISETKDAFTHSAKRDRKLLLKKKELNKLSDSLVKGLTILPYKIFMNDRGIVKMEIVLGRGKKLYDKRETIKERDISRELKKEY